MLIDLLLLIILFAACAGLGWLLFHAWQGTQPAAALDWLEIAAASLGLGVGVMGWLAVILAEVGWFSLAAIAWLWLLLVLLAAAWVWHQGLSLRPQAPHPPRYYWLLLLWLPLAGWLFLRPHQSIQGGADAGVYVSLAANITYTGRILIDDPVLAALDPALAGAFLRPLPPTSYAAAYYLPGFYAGEAPGQIIPQFYPLPPVWQAIAFSTGGDAVSGTLQALRLVGIWAILGCLAVFLLVRRLAGELPAWLVLAAMTGNALQIWFARYPVTETLTQSLLWLGVWAFIIWLEGVRQGESRPQWGMLAGLMLGSTQLARIDMFFLLALPAAAFLYLRARGDWTTFRKLSNLAWFFLPVTLLTAHSLVHALWQSRPYFFDIFGYIFRFSRNNPIPLLLGLAAVSGVFLVGWRGRGRVQLPDRWVNHLKRTLAGLVLLWGVFGWFIRPLVQGVRQVNDWYSGSTLMALDAINFQRLSWYLGVAGVWLGVAAMVWLVTRLDRRTLPWFAVGFLFSLLYLWRAQASHHQIYVMRRYVPVVMPFFLSAAAILLGHLMQQKRPIFRAAGSLLALLWLGSLLWLSRGFISQVDYADLTGQLAQLDQELPPNALLIFNDAAAVGVADFVGTPLRFIFARELLVWRDAAADPILLRQQFSHWQEEGRSLYWVAVPGGHPWPWPDVPLPASTLYPITNQVLEGSYEYRPYQIHTVTWNLELIVMPNLRP